MSIYAVLGLAFAVVITGGCLGVALHDAMSATRRHLERVPRVETRVMRGE